MVVDGTNPGPGNGNPGKGKSATLASEAYERLRREILDGFFVPGKKLHIRGLCERYEIGLSPMREALNRVSRDGLVRQSDLRGFSVAPVSVEDFADLTATRCSLDEIALRRSIAQGGPDWEEGILLAFHRFLRAPRFTSTMAMEDREAYQYAHRNFHLSLIAACGSSRLQEYCSQLVDGAHRYRYLVSPQEQGDRHQWNEHREIMDAALERDAEKAVALLVAHYKLAESQVGTGLRRIAAAQSEGGKGRKARHSGLREG